VPADAAGLAGPFGPGPPTPARQSNTRAQSCSQWLIQGYYGQTRSTVRRSLGRGTKGGETPRADKSHRPGETRTPRSLTTNSLSTPRGTANFQGRPRIVNKGAPIGNSQQHDTLARHCRGDARKVTRCSCVEPTRPRSRNLITQTLNTT